MGDIADYHVEMYSGGKWGMPRKTKKRYPKKDEKTCKHCGKDGLAWGKHNGHFRLFDGKKLHECINK